MNIEQLKQSGYIIYECISGSHSYGTNNADSDLDVRGVFRLPAENYLTLSDPLQQISDATNDVTFYAMKRFFELIKTSNPNLIELLFMPQDCVKFCSPVMQKIIDNRNLFISKKAYYTHIQYAHSQIGRARGQNKWINNKKPESPPNKMDFCWVIPMTEDELYTYTDIDGQKNATSQGIFPVRPILISNSYIELNECHVAGLEHLENAYRLYYYGEDAKGVFRGQNQQLAVESIPFDDEWSKFIGILIYNEDAYNSAYRDWKNYWEWKKERNEARYRSQEAGEVDYDCKNMMHCMRLLRSGKNILLHGEPIVRFEGEQLQFLKNIRAGKYSHEQIMEWVEQEMAELEKIKDESTLPHSVDHKAIERLYRELVSIG